MFINTFPVVHPQSMLWFCWTREYHN